MASPTAVHVALDLGCGPGLKTAWIAEHVVLGGQVLGIDHNSACFTQGVPRDLASWLSADAHALPLATASVDLVWCVAAFEFFSRPAHVLGEIRRILRPQGRLVIASAYQLWVRPRAWPPVVYDTWCAPAPPAGDGLGDDLVARMHNAGLVAPTCTAYLLDPPVENPIMAALPLVAWADLAPLVATHLTPQQYAACREAEKAAEPEPRSVLLVSVGQS